MTIHWVFTRAIPIVAIAAKLHTFECKNSTFELRIRNEALAEVYKMFEDNFGACTVFAYVEGVAKD